MKCHYFGKFSHLRLLYIIGYRTNNSSGNPTISHPKHEVLRPLLASMIQTYVVMICLNTLQSSCVPGLFQLHRLILEVNNRDPASQTSCISDMFQIRLLSCTIIRWHCFKGYRRPKRPCIVVSQKVICWVERQESQFIKTVLYPPGAVE